MLPVALALPGALAIGLSLGLLGSGGSILTVPVLVYLLGQDEKVAIASSLAIVGIIALVGSLPHLQQKRIAWRAVFFLVCPACWAPTLAPGHPPLSQVRYNSRCLHW